VSPLTILAVALALAMDAFAVSIAAGLAIRDLTGRHVFRLAWHFGLFQALMPIVGWLAGRTVAARIAAVDHWVAFGLLAMIGGKMLQEGWRGGGEPRVAGSSDPTRGVRLVLLSIATSIDALAVGLSLALLRVSVWFPALIIGVVAAGVTVVGILFGHRLGARWERYAEVVGGLVLLAIGVQILVSHLCG